MFFEAIDRAYYPTSQILRIGPPIDMVRDGAPTGRWHHLVGLLDGKTIKIKSETLGVILRTVAAIAAAPETYLVDVDEENPERYDLTAVIAWCIGADGTATPVTASGANDGLDNIPAILTPDGKVTQVGYCVWPSLKDFLAEQREGGAEK